MSFRNDSLALDFGQYQPTVVPAADTRFVADDLPFGVVKTIGAERVIFGHAPQFAEEVVGVDVVCPGTGHGLGDILGTVGREEFLDAT